jgi:hypothetical protein
LDAQTRQAKFEQVLALLIGAVRNSKTLSKSEVRALDAARALRKREEVALRSDIEKLRAQALEIGRQIEQVRKWQQEIRENSIQ